MKDLNSLKKEEIIKFLEKQKIKFSSSASKNNLLNLLKKEEKQSQKKATKKTSPQKTKTIVKKSPIKKAKPIIIKKETKPAPSKQVSVKKAPVIKKTPVKETPISSHFPVKDDFEKFHTLPDYKFLKSMKYEIPESYNLHKLVLLAIDPLWLYSYWEIKQEEIDKLLKKYGNEVINTDRLYLQIFDITNLDVSTGQPNYKWEYKIHQYKGNYFINSNKPEKNFLAVLGFKENNGHFITVLTSEIVKTPRDKMSTNREQIWAKIDIDGPIAMEMKKQLKEHIEYQEKMGFSSSFGGLFEELFGSNDLFKNK